MDINKCSVGTILTFGDVQFIKHEKGYIVPMSKLIVDDVAFFTEQDGLYSTVSVVEDTNNGSTIYAICDIFAEDSVRKAVRDILDGLLCKNPTGRFYCYYSIPKPEL